MTGIASGATILIRIGPGATDVDVSAWVAYEQGVSTGSGRSTAFSDISAGTASFVLRNEDGRFTPDNPLSPYYPYITEDALVTISVTRSATTYRRFTGYVTAWEPSFPQADRSSAIVAVSAIDNLGLLSRRLFHSQWHEEIVLKAKQYGGSADGFILDALSTVSGTTYENYGIDAGAGLGTAKVVMPYSGVGTIEYGSADDLMLESSAHFQPVNKVGPIIKTLPQSGCQVLSFWLKVPTTTLPTAVGSTLGVLDLWNAPASLGSIRLRNNAGVCDLTYYDPASTYTALMVAGVADGQWRKISINTNTGLLTSSWLFNGSSPLYLASPLDLRTLTHAYFGGGLNWNNEGKQVDCPEIYIASPMMLSSNNLINDNYVRPGKAVWTVGSRCSQWVLYLSSVIGAAYTVGTDYNRVTVNSDWTRITPYEAGQRNMRSDAGIMWVDPYNAVRFYHPDVLRPATVLATIDMEGDVDAVTQSPPTLSRSVESRPTRVTVSTPTVSVTAIDTVAEANSSSPREETIETDNYLDADAMSIGWARINQSVSLRITKISIDLATSQTNLWSMLGAVATLPNLFPTARLRITNLPTSIFGLSYRDVFVQGWTETHSAFGDVLTFDCTPADDPTEAIWDDAEYGRWAMNGASTVTSGTAVSTTAVGTAVVTTTGTPLSTAAGDYPLDLDWNGERVTITAAPAGSTSPQTVTITARGVAPGVARVHAAGESVQVWHAAAWAP